MPAEDQADVEALNAGLNTPEFEDDNPPGYGESDEVEEVDEAPEEPGEVEPSEEEETPTPAEKAHEEEEEDPKPLTRGQQRIQSLANEKKLAEERAKLLEMRLQQLEAERQQAARPQEDENLSDLEKWQRQADATIRQVQFQNMDMQDKSEFLMQVSKTPSEAAYIDRVEKTLAEARQSGFNPKREDVLTRLMGLDARAKAKQAPAVKREAAQRVTAAKGKPLAAKSNVAASKTESTEFDRLKDIIL